MAERVDQWLIFYLEGLEVYGRFDGQSTIYLHVQRGRDTTLTGLCGNGNGKESGTSCFHLRNKIQSIFKLCVLTLISNQVRLVIS